MAEVVPLSHTELPNHGFTLQSVEEKEHPKFGPYTQYHYTQTRNQIGGKLARPMVHHMYVYDAKDRPGNPDISYLVTDADGNEHAGGDFNHGFYSKSPTGYGSEDTVRDALKHHNAINFMLDKERSVPNPVEKVTPDNLHRIVPKLDLGSHPWDESATDSFGHIINPVGPRGVKWPNLRYHNSAPPVSEPLDPDVHRILSGGVDGVPKFHYWGRLEGDRQTDFYHADHPDPRSPHTFEYRFTVRHMPRSDKPYSYDVTRRQSGLYDDGSGDDGSEVDVTGDPSAVARFENLSELLNHHRRTLEKLNIIKSKKASMEKQADEFDDIIRGNNYSGNCEMCGKAVRNIPESSFRDDKLYHVFPEDEAPGMHGKPISLCGECTQNPDVIHNIQKNPKSFGWHHDGAKIGDCPDCDRSMMESADDDLLP